MEFIEIEIEPLAKLGVAALLGALIGLEREVHGRPAGLRTNALVCLASCLLIVVSRAGVLSGLETGAGFEVNLDPARMGAGIVTGIGFLGAGAILRIRENLVRGLTTAASIWFVAASGVAVGLGSYVLAVVATGLALLVLTVLHRLERAMDDVVYRTLTVTVGEERRAEVERECQRELREAGIRLLQTGYRIDNRERLARLLFAVRAKREHDDGELIGRLARLPEVAKVKWS